MNTQCILCKSGITLVDVLRPVNLILYNGFYKKLSSPYAHCPFFFSINAVTSFSIFCILNVTPFL